jgi:hypothetical protein
VAVTSILIATFAYGVGGIETGAYGEGLVNYTSPDSDSFWSGIPIIGTVADTAPLVSSFLGSLFGVLLWTLPEAIFPLWANLIFIKIPLIVLIIAIVEVLLP